MLLLYDQNPFWSIGNSDRMYCFFVFQYPLKEVVVIHQDPEALKDIQSLQKYILEVNKLFLFFLN